MNKCINETSFMSTRFVLNEHIEIRKHENNFNWREEYLTANKARLPALQNTQLARPIPEIDSNVNM